MVLGVSMRFYSASSLVSTGMGDRIVQILSWYVISHPRQYLLYFTFIRSSPSDLINWNLGLSICPSIRPSTESFSDFDLIWCVGRPRLDMRTSMTSTRSKVKMRVTELLKFRKLHFSRSISSTILAWSSKLTVDYDSMGPSLQLIGARFLNFLHSKLSHDFIFHGMSTLQDQRAIFPYCLRLESHGWVCW